LVKLENGNTNCFLKLKNHFALCFLSKFEICSFCPSLSKLYFVDYPCDCPQCCYVTCSWRDHLWVDGLFSSARIHVWFRYTCSWPLAQTNWSDVCIIATIFLPQNREKCSIM